VFTVQARPLCARVGAETSITSKVRPLRFAARAPFSLDPALDGNDDPHECILLERLETSAERETRRFLYPFPES
jgi:hypothetical protein